MNKKEWQKKQKLEQFIIYLKKQEIHQNKIKSMLWDQKVNNLQEKLMLGVKKMLTQEWKKKEGQKDV